VRRLLLALSILGVTSTSLADSNVTFTRDVAPLLYKHCTRCHHPNDIAPMSLMTYDEVRPWAAAIREAVVTRTMPPWHADPRYGKFSNDPRLTDTEIATIVAWVKSGAPKGDPEQLPPPPVYGEGWKIGKPDAVFDIGQDFQVQPNSPDEYRYFTISTNFDGDRWLTAVELRPGNRRIVHHAHVYLEQDLVQSQDGKTPLASRYQYRLGHLTHMKLDAPIKNDGCSVSDAGNEGAFLSNEGGTMMGSYLPGRGPELFPEGTAKRLPAGSKLTFQIHYSNGTGAIQSDRTEVGFKFASQAPDHPLHRIDISNYLFQIAPGAENQEVSECHSFDKNIRIYSLVAHMHYRGKDMRFDLVRPDGQQETLLFVPHYSFQWQQIYRFEDPVPVEKGSRLIITAHFDNSANNRWNPDPTRVIRWGEPSYEEMMDGWVEYIGVAPPGAASKEIAAEAKPN